MFPRRPRWPDAEHERERVRNLVGQVLTAVRRSAPPAGLGALLSKIAWPIALAVLPRYPQEQFAKMLSDYRDKADIALEGMNA